MPTDMTKTSTMIAFTDVEIACTIEALEREQRLHGIPPEVVRVLERLQEAATEKHS